jgi:hypothetical protein
MKDIAIAIKVGSPNSNPKLIKKTFDSIKNNIGGCDWKVFICLGLNIPKEANQFVREYISQNPDKFEIFLNADVSWAEFINQAIDLSSEYEYFIKAHDDIELLSTDFFQKLTNILKSINKEVGWISFHDVAWKKGNLSTSTREGYFIDALEDNSWGTQQIFQFHLFPPHWTKAPLLINYGYYGLRRITNFLKLPTLPYPKPAYKIKHYQLDMPTAPVKCHAPFNNFVLIKRSVLNKIGKCVEWNTNNALYVDEDWGLRCLEMNIPNIWIPSIEHFHNQGKFETGGTRSWNIITKDAVRVENLFYQKWGFHPIPTPEELKQIREKHQNNLIPWSSYRRSWEWDYI